MKKIILLSVLLYTLQYVSAQDLGINYVNYSNGTLLNSSNLPDGKIQTAFRIINYGSSIINATDQVYLSARINGTYYKLDLTTTGSSYLTPGSSIPVNGSFSNNPGYLSGPLTLAYLGTTSVEICVVVYGVGSSSVNNSFPLDPEPCNNITCVMYSNTVTSYNNDCAPPTTSVIPTLEQDVKLEVYPQPAYHEVNFDFSSINIKVDKVILTNIFGVPVLEESIDQNEIKTIDINKLSKGIYFGTFYSADKIIAVKKIIIG